ncbi:unnamed protein product [Symbiodinium sp. CCMP2592]|nr:unnamed protein product [Symbiodinium sp. CCMP2592]
MTEWPASVDLCDVSSDGMRVRKWRQEIYDAVREGTTDELAEKIIQLENKAIENQYLADHRARVASAIVTRLKEEHAQALAKQASKMPSCTSEEQDGCGTNDLPAIVTKEYLESLKSRNDGSHEYISVEQWKAFRQLWDKAFSYDFDTDFCYDGEAYKTGDLDDALYLVLSEAVRGHRWISPFESFLRSEVWKRLCGKVRVSEFKFYNFKTRCLAMLLQKFPPKPVGMLSQDWGDFADNWQMHVESQHFQQEVDKFVAESARDVANFGTDSDSTDAKLKTNEAKF